MHQKQQEGKRYYLYRHIRLDKNEVIYIGKGTVKNYKSEKSRYQRGYEMKAGRSKLWKNTVKKGGRKVQILFESEDQSFILNKEIEFIKLYGRKDLGTGTLCNLTDGGEKESGYIYTDEARANMRKNNTSKNRKGALNPKAVKVFAYTIDGEFYKKYDCMADCSRDLGVNQRTISEIANRENSLQVNRKRQKSTNGFMFFLEYRGDKIQGFKKNLRVSYTIVNLIDENSNIIKSFRSIKDATLYTGDTWNSVSRSSKLDKPSRRGNLFKIIS